MATSTAAPATPADDDSAIAEDDESGVAVLRDTFKPRRVVALFVGESSPAQGTHFYRANSNLFRATRAAFAQALGDGVVASGEAFLRQFATTGCWLVDLADRPVNRMETQERRQTVAAGVPRLAELIRQTRPKHVVVIKRDIAAAVEGAIEASGVRKPALLVLRFPLRQYRAAFVSDLAQFVRESLQSRAAW